MEQHNNTIQHVLDRIKDQTLTAKPRYYFVLRLIALLALIAVTIVISTFIFSFILFSLRTQGQFSLFGFGGRGIEIFLLQFPWLLFLIDIVLIIVTERLLRTFRFGYTYPMLYIGIAASVVVIAASVGIQQTHLHDNLLQEADHQRLPGLNNLYEAVRHAAPPPEGHDLYRGIVTDVTPQLIVTIQHRDGTTMPGITVLDDHDNMPVITIGDELFISGSLIGNTLEAEHIAELPPRPQQ